MAVPNGYRVTTTVTGISVIIYNTEAGGSHPIHGAYWGGPTSFEESDYAFEWIPTCWMKNGRRFKERVSDLDLVLSFEEEVEPDVA